MHDPLRDRRPLRELASNSQAIDFTAEIADFPRLTAALEADLGTLDADARPPKWPQRAVSGRLDFGTGAWDRQTATLDIDVETLIAAVCQRCLNAFDLPIEVSLRLQFAGPNEAGKARDGFELWELDDDTVVPLDVVDEALTMALPIAARHRDPRGCVDVESAVAEDNLIKPFASLRAQMEGDNQD